MVSSGIGSDGQFGVVAFEDLPGVVQDEIFRVYDPLTSYAGPGYGVDVSSSGDNSIGDIIGKGLASVASLLPIWTNGQVRMQENPNSYSPTWRYPSRYPIQAQGFDSGGLLFLGMIGLVIYLVVQ